MFYVETEYSADDFEVNTEKLKLSNQSLKNAVEIAQKYDDKSDYDKIMGYANEIIKLNTYNLDAANNGSESREPWDLIYVFDKDPDTNALCEGYAKAFEYLCHLGGIECYIVDGSMGGPHAWNVVVLDGVSYHADVTMADDGSNLFDEYHQFVLTPAISSSKEKCEFDFKYGNHGFAGTYAYSAKTQSLYPEELLAVSTQPYSSKEPDPEPEPDPDKDQIELTDETGGTGIVVIAEKDVLDENTVLNVEEKTADPEKPNCITYDITLKLNGEKVQPNGSVTVKIPVPEAFADEECKVYYRDLTNGEEKLVDMGAVVLDGFLVFTAEHFSEYIVTAEDLVSKSLLGDLNNDGKVTIVDARWLLQAASGSRELTEEQKAVADINGDGKITIVDARWLLQAASDSREL